MISPLKAACFIGTTTNGLGSWCWCSRVSYGYSSPLTNCVKLKRLNVIKYLMISPLKAACFIGTTTNGFGSWLGRLSSGWECVSISPHCRVGAYFSTFQVRQNFSVDRVSHSHLGQEQFYLHVFFCQSQGSDSIPPHTVSEVKYMSIWIWMPAKNQ